MNYKFLLLALLNIAIAAGCKQQTIVKMKNIDLSNFDTNVSPVNDFYQYANGGWMLKNPLPADKSRFGTFDELNEKNELQLKDIIDETIKSNQEQGSVNEKIKFFFETGMDSAKINKLGAEPLKPLIARIDAINDLKDLQNYIDDAAKNGEDFMFDFGGGSDKKNSEIFIAQISQGRLGLPDKSYYFDKGEHADKIRQDYMFHIQKMLELTGVDAKIAENASKQIFDIESKLAEASLSRVQLRDEELTYNKMTLVELSKLNKNFNWNQYFTSLGLPDSTQINVESPTFLKTLDILLNKIDIENWKWYMKWSIISKYADFLSDDFVNENFAFYGKILTGQKEIRPRWKRVLDVTQGALSQALGQVYVSKYFPASSKERMEKLIENLREAFKQRIKNLDWMSDSTKQKAIEKLDAITVKVGYPDKWRDYSKLVITNHSYFNNVISARKFNFEYMLNKINKPVDRSEWHMPPQMVNAYYNPSNNEIVFPAGILQPPFFFADGDDAVNYGAIGVVIGHEMTHGFDDVGSLFDKNGNMNSWWTIDDRNRFNERTKKLIEMFNLVTILDTVNANGELTLGENIADLGGLNISLTAYKNTDEYKANKSIDGFTPTQRFFLAYARVWAQNISNQEKLRRTKVDVHSLGNNRVNVTIRNLTDFQESFAVKQGDKMFLAPSDRIKIW